MQVCLCNALTERAVERAVRDGAATPAQIYAALDCAPQCGRCLPFMRDMVGQPKAGADERQMSAAE